MKKYKFLPVFGVILLSLIIGISISPVTKAQVSFSDFNQLFQENVTNLTITINQNESQANLYFNIQETPFDQQTINSNDANFTNICNELNITLWCNQYSVNNFSSVSFTISDFLNAINGSIEIKRGDNAPQLSNLEVSTDNITISGIYASTGAIIQKEINLSSLIPNLSEINNFLASNPPPINSDRNINFTKEGNNYTLWNNEGYGDLGPSTMDQIRQIINQSVESMTVQQMVNEIIPIANNLSNGTGDTISSLLSGININYTVSGVDLSNIKLEDGNYIVNVSISNGTSTYYKPIYLVLQGIQNTDSGIADANGVYTPTNPEVLNYLDNITGLSNGTRITVSLFDSPDPSSSFPSDKEAVVKYLDFTVSPEPSSSATIYFKIPIYKNIDQTRIFLYHLDNATNSWTQLTTNYITSDSNFYYFSATTTSFSPFMIMETTTPVSVSYPSSGGSVYGGKIALPVIQAQNSTPAPTTNTPTTPATPPTPGFFGRITGAVVGTLGTGGSIVALIVVVLIIGGTITVLVMNRKAGKKAEKKE